MSGRSSVTEHSVENWGFFCLTFFTWNQFLWMIQKHFAKVQSKIRVKNHYYSNYRAYENAKITVLVNQKGKKMQFDNFRGFEFWYWLNLCSKKCKNSWNLIPKTFRKCQMYWFWSSKLLYNRFHVKLRARRIYKFPYCKVLLRRLLQCTTK